jgi:pimeloyl-ACP methyl ester carboxylesterase
VIDRVDGRARCVAVNQRGWGESHATDGRYDLAAMADDVQAIVAALSLQRYVLVGHSMGGKVAQIVATRRPASLLGLVLVAPAPPTPMPVPPKILPMLRNGSFMRGFTDKGRFSGFMKTVEVSVALNPAATLIGAAHYALRI